MRTSSLEAQVAEEGQEIRRHRPVDGVQALGTVQGDDADALVDREEDVLLGHGDLLLTIDAGC